MCIITKKKQTLAPSFSLLNYFQCNSVMKYFIIQILSVIPEHPFLPILSAMHLH